LTVAVRAGVVKYLPTYTNGKENFQIGA